MSEPRQVLVGRFNFELHSIGDAVYAVDDSWLCRITASDVERRLRIAELPWGIAVAPPLCWIATQTGALYAGNLEAGTLEQIGDDGERFEPGVQSDGERLFLCRIIDFRTFELVARPLDGHAGWATLYRAEGADRYRIEHVDEHDAFCTTDNFHRLDQRDKHDGTLVTAYEVPPELRTRDPYPRWCFDERSIYWSVGERLYTVPKRELSASPYGRGSSRVEVKPRLAGRFPGAVLWLDVRDGEIYAMCRRKPGWFDASSHVLYVLAPGYDEPLELCRLESKHISVPFAVGRTVIWLLVLQERLLCLPRPGR